MISDSHTRYGSRVFCHGSAWRPWLRCQVINRSENSAPTAVPATPCGATGSALRRTTPRNGAFVQRLLQRQVQRQQLGAALRAGAGLLAQAFEQFAGALQEVLQPPVLLLELGDAQLQIARGVL